MKLIRGHCCNARKSHPTIEWRKKFLIGHYAPRCQHLLDLGAGHGQYMPYLKRKAHKVVAVDYNYELCTTLSTKGYLVVQADARALPFRSLVFDCIWASEIIEHLPSLDIFDEIERVSSRRLIITMPNPLSPHFREDPTHILNYSVFSLIKHLAGRDRTCGWNYHVRGLGIDDIPVPNFVKRLTTYVMWYLPWISPTITVLGERKHQS